MRFDKLWSVDVEDPYCNWIHPSIPRLNGCSLQCWTMYSWQWGPIASLMIAVVNIILNRGPRCADVLIGRLCCIKITSALMASLLEFGDEKNWKIFWVLFVCHTCTLCASREQWSLMSFKPWWLQLICLLQEIHKKEWGSFFTFLTGYSFSHSDLYFTLYFAEPDFAFVSPTLFRFSSPDSSELSVSRSSALLSQPFWIYYNFCPDPLQVTLPDPDRHNCRNLFAKLGNQHVCQEKIKGHRESGRFCWKREAWEICLSSLVVCQTRVNTLVTPACCMCSFQKINT